MGKSIRMKRKCKTPPRVERGGARRYYPSAQDPVAIVLQAVIDMLWGGRSKAPLAFDNIEKAMRLGLHSERLARHVAAQRVALAQARRQSDEIAGLARNDTVSPPLPRDLTHFNTWSGSVAPSN